ncbi:MAG TPA: chemotaxis protein CheW [Chloroflexia bacterium]|nr:chemotaxis protein CheW [Chloroflexia bacterium]
MTSDPNISTMLDEMNRKRALSAEAGGDGAAEDVPLRRVLGMNIGSELYGIAIESINEISKLTPVTFVPSAPTYIMGVTSLRGSIVPIVNLRMILGVEAPRSDRPLRAEAGAGGRMTLQAKPRIVVVHHNDRIAGLVVDSVTEVYDLRVVLEPPMGAPSRGLQIKEGQTQLGDRVLILLHVPTLFAQLAES